MSDNNYASSSSSQRNNFLDEEHQRDIDNNVEMHRNSQMVMAENIAVRPINTTLAYHSKQNEFKVRYRSIYAKLAIQSY